MSNYAGEKILKKHIIDNSCGDGAFLEEIVKRYCQIAISKKLPAEEIASDLFQYIHGIEIDEIECNKCRLKMMQIANSFGIKTTQFDIRHGSALKIRDYDNKMDFVIGNPPYVRIHNIKETNEVKKFSFAQGGMTDLFIVFYEIGLRMLNSSGTLGYITPSSFFSSLAGEYMRSYLSENLLLKKVVDLKHTQVFSATTYATIIVLQKGNRSDSIDYYCFDETKNIPKYTEQLLLRDYYIAGNFYFSSKQNLNLLKKILNNYSQSDIYVKNGYATLCDQVFIKDANFESPFAIPVVKASQGVTKKIIFPYDENAKILPESVIKTDQKLYEYLLTNKAILLQRSCEKTEEEYWYAFGRSQALIDTYKDKIAINTLIRNEHDLKFVMAPKGTGVYSGLYILSNTVPLEEIKNTLCSEEFAIYVSLLSKYKSGGYYTFSTKDVKRFLDYKFSSNERLF